MSFWRERPGLAGGIDKEGSRAVELLSIGFGSVEFGTVTPQPVPGQQPGHNPGVDALVARLAGIHQIAGGCRIGVSLGAGPDVTPDTLAAAWLAGQRAAWPVADYLCFNLSARAYQPLLAAQHTGALKRAIAAVVYEREQLRLITGRQVAVALKFPLAFAGREALVGMGLDALIAVLPEDETRLSALRQFASSCQGGPTLIAVGGMRSTADVSAVLAAGAEGIQVHGAFVDHGADCLPALLAGMQEFPSGMQEFLATARRR